MFDHMDVEVAILAELSHYCFLFPGQQLSPKSLLDGTKMKADFL